MAERTGCPVFLNLWSYVPKKRQIPNLTIKQISGEEGMNKEGTQVAKRRILEIQDDIVKKRSILVAGGDDRFWAIQCYS